MKVNIGISRIKSNSSTKIKQYGFKRIRKAFNGNEKAIKQTLERYESGYTTKTNVTIYKLMVIALNRTKYTI